MKSIPWQYWKYLFWLAPLLITAGLTVGLLNEQWGILPLTLITTGIVLGVLWLASITNSQNFWRQRSTQVGTNALIATGAMLVILGLINFLGVRYINRIDLTENQQFTLASQSQELVKNLSEPVKVWIFENDSPGNRQLLENYQRNGSKFDFQFVDPESNPGLAQKFNVQRVGEVYLESNNKKQLLQVLGEGEIISESKLTNGIQKLSSDRISKIYFLQGHGEHPLEDTQGGLSQAISSLNDKNFTTEPLNLAERSDIPKDAAVIVIAGAKKPLFDAEVNALNDYLKKGGTLLVMTNPNTNPGLDNLLKGWGVQLDNRLVIDASGNGRLVGLGPATALINQYGQHPITKDFQNNFSFYPLARPVETKPIKGITQTTLLQTDDKSWAESTPEQQPLEFNAEGDRPGPVPIGVALSRSYPASPESGKSNAIESRLVVIGNSDFATNGLFDKQLNGDVFLNSISWLSNQDQQTLSIRPKEAKDRRINLSPQQAGILTWTATLIIPLIGIITSAMVWWRRR